MVDTEEPSKSVKIPPGVPLSLHGQQTFIYLALPFLSLCQLPFSPLKFPLTPPMTTPNNYPQHPFLSLAEDGIQGENFGY